jgi:ATP-dependent RNA helicase DHX37/DHR1
VFSSAVFNDQFEKFESPEILTSPIDAIVLSMKAMGINDVKGFPFPTPPPTDALNASLATLR